MSSAIVLATWLIITVAAFVATLGNQLPSEPHCISISTDGLLWDQVAFGILESVPIARCLGLLLVESVYVLLLGHAVGKVISLIQSILLLCQLLSSLILRAGNRPHMALILILRLTCRTCCPICAKPSLLSVRPYSISWWKLIKLHFVYLLF